MFSLSPLRRLVVPLLLLAGAAVFRERILAIEPYYRPLTGGLPYVLFAVALGLSAYYNNSRLFTAALALLAAYWLIDSQLQVRLTWMRTLFVYSMLSIALPLTLLSLLLFPERGLLNRYGALPVMSVPLQLLVGFWIYKYHPDAVVAVNRVLPAVPLESYYLSVPASVVFALVFLAGLFALFKYDSEHAAALLAALLFGFVTLAFFKTPRISTIMFAAAGASLIVSLVRSSHAMAYRDELTGLRGRRALNERLKGLGRRYAIAMIDVDHFKKFNDTHGHDTGDEVLKMVATKLSAVKGGGTVYRYGGEEFCIVFTGKRLEACLPHLEAVRAAVAGYELAIRDRRIRPKSAQAGRQRRSGKRGGANVSVTVSIGAAECEERGGRPADVLKAADAALYRAKRNGRNCLVH